MTKNVRQEIAIHSDSLIRGDAGSFAEYREKVGIIRALRACEVFLIDMNNKMDLD